MKKSLNDKTKVSIKYSITDSNINIKSPLTSRINGSNFNCKNLKPNNSSYYSKNQNKIKKITILKTISDYSELKDSYNVSNQNINNTIIKNYSNFDKTINDYQIKKANINNICKTNYCNNKFVTKIQNKNYANKKKNEINYQSNYKILCKNKSAFLLQNDKKNNRAFDYKTKLENFNAYPFGNDKKKIRVHDYKSLFGNYTSFFFHNGQKKY